MIKSTIRTILALALILSADTLMAQRLDRGIRHTVFVPRGQWLVGGNLGYSTYDFEEYKFLVLDGMNADGYNLSISPFVGYFFRDNVAAGARFGYTRSKVRIDNLNIDLGEDINLDINDYYNISQSYYGTAMLRTYAALGNGRRFGLFNETRLTVGGGNGKVVSGSGEDITGTYQRTFEAQIGMAPGLAAFITNDVAVEVSVGVLGFEYKKVTQTTDQIYKGSLRSSGANFKIDLFSINLGLAFYIPAHAKNSKNR